jgi:hypothetical protein
MSAFERRLFELMKPELSHSSGKKEERKKRRKER